MTKAKNKKAPGKNDLGRALYRQKNKHTGQNPSRSKIHTLKDAEKGNEGVLESITEQNDLAEFMTKVAANEQNYEKRNCDIKLLTPLTAAGILSDNEKADINRIQRQHINKLRIPRRPEWNEDTTADELHTAESSAFYEWRRQLSELEKVNNLTITPYEKNCQVWQQLWRVVERSDVVVQIVDARTPLLFRCVDLEAYVKEVEDRKVNLILINKSDFLTAEQRQVWASYFNDAGVYAVFFSALESSQDMGGLEVVPESDEGESDTQEEADEMELRNTLSNLGVSNNAIINENSVNNNDTAIQSTKTFADVNDASDSDSEGGYESASSSPDSLVNVNPSINSSDSIPTRRITTSKLYDREELIQLFQEIAPAPKLLQTITTIGLVGYPNVGKSSTINCLLEQKKVTVSATPGKTKHFQTLHLSPTLVLCDCPGLVFPGFVSTKQEMILWGILSIDRLRRDYHSSVMLICHTIPPAALEAAFSIPLPGGSDRPPTPEELLTAYSVTRSFMSARGRGDVSRAGRSILKDFMNGRLLHCVAPPEYDQASYHVHDVQMKSKNRVKLTPRQQLYMPETEADIENHLDSVLGVIREEDNSGYKGTKPKKQRVKKPKGLIEYKEGPDGKIEAIITKPWRNKPPRTIRGKKNPNTNNPYESELW